MLWEFRISCSYLHCSKIKVWKSFHYRIPATISQNFAIYCFESHSSPSDWRMLQCISVREIMNISTCISCTHHMIYARLNYILNCCFLYLISDEYNTCHWLEYRVCRLPPVSDHTNNTYFIIIQSVVAHCTVVSVSHASGEDCTNVQMYCGAAVHGTCVYCLGVSAAAVHEMVVDPWRNI